jgi:hypothetical protein
MVIGGVLAVLLLAHPVLAQNVTAEKFGDLYFVPYTDPATKMDLSFVVSDDLYSSVERSGGLLWGCEGDDFTVIIEPDVMFFTEEQLVTVQWRFDSQPMRQAKWPFGPDRLMLIAPSSIALEFLESSNASAQLAVRIIDESTTQYDYEFSLRGFAAASARLACLPVSPSSSVHLHTPAREHRVRRVGQFRCVP